jgi:hypothetical protein
MSPPALSIIPATPDPAAELAAENARLREALRQSEAQARQTEAHLTQALRMKRMAMQIGGIAAWAWDVGADHIQCTDDIAAVLGRKPPFAPTLREAIEAYAPDSRPLLRQVMRRCMDDGSPFDIEAEVIADGGAHRWVRVLCEAEWDAQGRVVRLNGALLDVTESRSARAELQESQRMLAGLMANLPGMAYRAANAHDWPLEFASEGALALTGCTPQQLMDLKPAYGELIHPDDRAWIWDAVQEALAARRQFQLTYRLVVDGREKWVWEQGAGVYRPDGSLRCIEGLITDVTASHLAQLEVARLNGHLEERVRERTAQLEQANAELEAMAYSIAHDLRAPMTSLDGYSRLLERSLPPLEGRSSHFFERIRRNVRHMSDLTDALLSLARLSAVRLDPQPVDLAVLARDVLAALVAQDPPRACDFSIAPALPVRGDRKLLQQLMANLLGNAWKFSRGKPVTRIRVGSHRGEDGTTIYTVADEGAGFDMAHAASLFTAFHRLHAPGEFEGTGIGLALVRKIVARHGGRVWADSAPGVGTTISFTLG